MIPNRPVTQADLDHAREALERANFKLGKARSKSILSTAQAAVDAQDLQACVEAASKAENEFAQIAERFVTPVPIADAELTATAPLVVTAQPLVVTAQPLGSFGIPPKGLDGEELHDAFRTQG